MGTISGTSKKVMDTSLKPLQNNSQKEAQRIDSPLPKRLYTLREAGHYMGRTVWSMRELVWAGKLPIVRDGKRIWVDKGDMDAYIEANKETYV